MGKPMREHLPFAMAWWHNMCATGLDMFGAPTADKSFGAQVGTMEHAKAKVDAGFEFMQKLGLEYFCFHDVDIVPEADTIAETNKRLDEVSDYIKASEIYHDIVPRINIEHLDKLCEVLECDISDLLEYTPNRQPITEKHPIIEQHGRRRQK